MNKSALGKFACILCLSFFSFASISSNAAIVESGDLNIIDDPGNASDGLRFLDMTYSDGLTQSAALANAQGTYANARLATPDEWDDLFEAANASFFGSLRPSDAFLPGVNTVITDGWARGEIVAFIEILGITDSDDQLLVWSEPNSDNTPESPRDLILVNADAGVEVRQNLGPPPSVNAGWFLVTEAATAVPLPAAGWLFMSALVGLVGKKRLSRR